MDLVLCGRSSSIGQQPLPLRTSSSKAKQADVLASSRHLGQRLDLRFGLNPFGLKRDRAAVTLGGGGARATVASEDWERLHCAKKRKLTKNGSKPPRGTNQERRTDRLDMRGLESMQRSSRRCSSNNSNSQNSNRIGGSNSNGNSNSTSGHGTRWPFLYSDELMPWLIGSHKPKTRTAKAAAAAQVAEATTRGDGPRSHVHQGAYLLDAAVCQQAHASRGGRCGEDAHLIEGNWVGVADGLKGWAEQGVNSGLYCQELMWNCAQGIRGTDHFSDSDSEDDTGPEDRTESGGNVERNIDLEDGCYVQEGFWSGDGGREEGTSGEGGMRGEETSGKSRRPRRDMRRRGRQQGSDLSPKQVLLEAHLRTELKGSCTVSLAVLQGQRLHVANIGDSGFLLARGGTIMAQSRPMHHEFDMPFHIGCNFGDEPSCAMEYEVDVMPGDVLLLGTDGLFDNLFPDEIVASLFESQHDCCSPEVAAKRLVAAAFKRSQNVDDVTPFSEAAKVAGRQHAGGKTDDITALVAFVT